MSSTAIVPMVEVYSPGMAQTALAGLDEWSQVTNVRQAIVLVAPEMIAGYWPTFKAWEAKIKRCELIPGMYTNPFVGGRKFDSMAGWKKVRNLFRQFSPRCAIVIDHELSLRQYLIGEYTPDWTAYRGALKLMLEFSEIWWYPSIEGDEARQKRYVELLMRTQDVLGYRLRAIDHAWVGYRGGGPNSTGSLACRKALDDLMGNPPINMIYLEAGAQYWPDAQFPEALALAYSSSVIPYPGSARFRECGKAMQTVLAAGQPTADAT